MNKEKKKIYVVTKDLQGEEFKVGFTGTADEFRQAFLYYAEAHEDAIAKLNTLEGQELIDFIASYWELKIEVKEK